MGSDLYYLLYVRIYLIYNLYGIYIEKVSAFYLKIGE